MEDSLEIALVTALETVAKQSFANDNSILNLVKILIERVITLETKVSILETRV